MKKVFLSKFCKVAAFKYLCVSKIMLTYNAVDHVQNL